jgi:hypothetical protein
MYPTSLYTYQQESVLPKDREFKEFRASKPWGFMLLPYPKDQTPPVNPPNPLALGRWIVINAGWGAAPVFGYLVVETGLENLEASEASESKGNVKGHYVFIEITSREAAWAWIPEIDSSFGMK